MHYVCSDIHGQIDLYKKLLDQLHLQDDDILYIIGDVIDRGPDSIGILLDIMRRPNVELFLGNHEMMMLDNLYRRGDYPGVWLRENNGGYQTKKDLQKFSFEEQEKIINYVKSSWIQKYVTIGDTKYALHHSYWLSFCEGEDIRNNEADCSWDELFTAVWYSPYRLYECMPSSFYEDEYIHIIGHVPVQRIEKNLRVVQDGEIDIHDIKPPFIDAHGHIMNIDGGCALIPYAHVGGLYCMSLEKDANGKRKEFWITA